MPKLVLTKDGQVVREHIITKEDTIIGRAQECDVAIGDESVSRRHLHIICILGDCFLEDMNSANGTLVNNRLTKKCPLNDGDIISIGHHEIQYDTIQYAKTSDEEFDKTRIKLIKQLGEPDVDETGLEPSPEETPDLDTPISKPLTEPSVESTPEPALEDSHTPPQRSEPDVEDEKQLEPEAIISSRTKAENPKARTGNLKIVSGKREGHNMALNKSVTGIDKAGQRVAAITRRPDGYFLVPLGDGTQDNIKVLVNGSEVSRKIYPLWSNDIIELGGTEMEFLFED